MADTKRPTRYPRPASFRDADSLRSHLRALEVDLPVDDQLETGDDAPLRRPIELCGKRLGNRFCVLPMEGWDGTRDGRPSELTVRRWERFGRSGAALIWGGEAVAVRPDGRANPNQLCLTESNVDALARLRQRLLDAHLEEFGSVDGVLVGLQLTHSGRFACPHEHGRHEPLFIYHHPWLDRRVKLARDARPLSDEELDRLAEDFVVAARRAYDAGFEFVDIKHCHGYLGHELLSAFDREGCYGGPLENRTRFLRTIVEGIRAEVPRLGIGVRVSLFDFMPFEPGPDGVGRPALSPPYRYAFGGDGSGVGIDWQEPLQFLRLCHQMGIRLVCISAGSPYYNPHIQRPAAYPPSDGYLPPEDPLVGVARLQQAARVAKEAFPDLVIVCSGLSYLQEWIPSVSQALIRGGWADFVGLGRSMLPYPELVRDALEARPLQRRKICRTFSDCTTAPRNGLRSGCYPLDPVYKALPDARILAERKEQLRRRRPQQ